MNNIMDSINKNSGFILTVIVVVIIICFLFFSGENGSSDKKKVEEFVGVPVSTISDITGEEQHSILVTTEPGVDGKVNAVQTIPVTLSDNASVVISQPGRPLPVISPTIVANTNVVPAPTANNNGPCPANSAMSGNPNFICDKVALSPDTPVRLQGYEDDINLYVPCGLNYDFPDIYRYRILKKFDFDAKKVEASKYDYGQFGRYNTNLGQTYDDTCRRF